MHDQVKIENSGELSTALDAKSDEVTETNLLAYDNVCSIVELDPFLREANTADRLLRYYFRFFFEVPGIVLTQHTDDVNVGGYMSSLNLTNKA